MSKYGVGFELQLDQLLEMTKPRKAQRSSPLQVVIRQHRTGVWYVEGDRAFESSRKYESGFFSTVFNTATEAKRAVKNAFPRQPVEFSVRPRLEGGKARR